MVASPDEGKTIVKLLLKRFSIEDILLLLADIQKEVGEVTTNESLRETIILLNKLLEEKWESLRHNPNDTPFQVQEY